jgi:putative methyltransferase (TIGR04325 family)
VTVNDPFYIWEGIFPSFDAAPGSTHVFAESSWVTRSRDKALALRARAAEGGSPSFATAAAAYCFPVIAAVAQAEVGRVRILDFGGSVGFTFHAVVDALARPDDVEYHLVDNATVCAAGREVFRGEPRITFHSEVPAGRFDVVHLGSSLQYVPDWLRQVRELALREPRYLVFDDVPAGDIPTFVSLQNYYGSKIPHWFWNVDEFVSAVERATGYRLFYKARFVGTFLGKTGPVPMDNFPPSHRIEHPCNFAFVRA